MGGVLGGGARAPDPDTRDNGHRLRPERRGGGGDGEGRPTGGYTIGIEEVARSGDTLYARVRETSPGDGCILTQAITHPRQAVPVPVSDVSVPVTVERTSTYDCD